MFDDPLHEQLADLVRPIASLPIPDIRVLRRRARRRGIRRGATAATATLAVAGIAIGAIVSLPGTGRPAGGRPVSSSSSSSSGSAGDRLVTSSSGTWNPRAWRPAGPQPAADAGPAVAPFIVFGVPAGGTVQVRNIFTWKTVATIQPLRGQFLVGVAAAGDDRTFVIQAEVGGTYQVVNGRDIGPPRNPTGAAFDELRLGADGRPVSLVLLGTVPARDALSGFAISQDASMLAYANSRNSGFDTVSLATGKTRGWVPFYNGTVAPESLSWAGDQTLAFEWSTGDNLHPPGLGMRVLDVTAPGNLLTASRLVVGYTRYCGARAPCQDGQLLTSDGSTLLITRVVTAGQDYLDSVAEYSVRTGQRLAQVIPTVRTPYAGPPCLALWADPSGEQVVSFCGEHGELYDHGHLSRITLHPPMYGLNFAIQFAW